MKGMRRPTVDFGGCRTGKMVAAVDLLARVSSLGFSCDEEDDEEEDADSGTEDRINRICRQMEEFAFCSQTFHQSLKGGSADYIGLTGIANNQAYTKATSTFGYVEELLRSVSDPTLKNALIVCENAYKVVKDAFGEGIQSFAQRDYRGMLNAERIAPRAQASCTSIFSTTPPPKQNPLSQINREMRILIAMAIVSGSSIG
ncbi:putative invertase inhibitor [Cucumis melo var. makuwa]|uniref:Putative invertase inhibitor n=1 Tax=Cucumis melo var. makuwa TaxID=1194695 RepID=A0A5D3BBV9_CUCMM|nr:putative invertase inhibitor [Cucumis melo var. makuwa]